MNIFNYFKKNGIDTVDKTFYRKIEEWISWYNANVRRFTFYKVYTGRGTYKKCQRKSMNMAKKLSEDIADLLLNERVTITLKISMPPVPPVVHVLSRFLLPVHNYKFHHRYFLGYRFHLRHFHPDFQSLLRRRPQKAVSTLFFSSSTSIHECSSGAFSVFTFWT